MKKYEDKSVIVFDHGGYVEVAKSLSKDFGKVYYYIPWETGFPKSNDTLIGTGYEEFERINHFWDYIDKADLIVFTDIYHGDLQEYLVKTGKRVWGAREGDMLEISRYEFFQHLEKIGLPIPPTQQIIGIDNLRKYLSKNEDKFVKLDSTLRGEVETFHHIDYEITEPILDKLEYKVGPKKDDIKFIVQDPIDTKAEIGYDGWCIDGQFPDTCLFGIEVKDKGYIGEVRKYEDIPKEIREVNEKLAPTLKAYGYRQMLSTEIRVGTDGKPYLIDITCRFPSPPACVLLEILENFAEVVYEGAGGNLVQPVYRAKYGAEVIGMSAFAKEGNFCNVFGEGMMHQYSAMMGGKATIVPQSWENERVCEMVAIGDSIESVIKELSDKCGSVKCHQFTIDPSVLKDAVEELKNL